MDLISVDEARARVLATVAPLPGEEVAMRAALGRVLAEDVAAELDLPPFRSSAMDGYALAAGPGGELPVVGESRAGAPYASPLSAGCAVRISTGAVVPDGADAVVPIERADVLDERVRVPDSQPGQNVREAGEDVRAGRVVLHAGARIGPSELAMLTALGRESLTCARRPRVAVLATGDELRAPGEPLGPGQIRNSNGAGLTAQAQLAGAEVVSTGVVRDDRGATLAALRQALETADVVCVSGGVSVGPHDHVRPALAELGVEQLIWGVRLKPGKPFWFGIRASSAKSAPKSGVNLALDGETQWVFGVPGNPVSAAVTFRLFVDPALHALQGADAEVRRSVAVLDASVACAPDRDQAVRCLLRVADDGFHVEPTGPQGSHVLSSMLGAAALALIPEGRGEIAAGERVTIELL